MLGNDRKGYYRRWLRTLSREVGLDDPAALREMIELRDELTAMIVDSARTLNDRGYSWADIARDLGCSRVTAFQRFARPTAKAVASLIEEPASTILDAEPRRV